jgi:hypothetical protein
LSPFDDLEDMLAAVLAHYDHKDFATALALIEREGESFPGGQAAAWMTLNGVVRGCGFIIAAAPNISDPAIWEPFCLGSARRGLRGVILAGDRDSFASAGAVVLKSLMDRGNVPCRLHLYPELGHVYPPDFKNVLREGLTFILGSQ